MPVVLAGGNELRPGCEEMDRRVLQEAGGADAHVVFLPTAVAHYDPQGSGRGAVAYWNRLGARCEVAMILGRADAGRPEWVEMIERATVVYLGGGDPDVLLDALAGSAAWAAALRVYERGGVVGGSSAGAMVVCSHTLLPGKRPGARTPWVDGLGLVTNALVLPHYRPEREASAVELSARFSREVSPQAPLFGIPAQQALLGRAGDWEVAGRGPITVFVDGVSRSYGSAEHIE